MRSSQVCQIYKRPDATKTAMCSFERHVAAYPFNPPAPYICPLERATTSPYVQSLGHTTVFYHGQDTPDVQCEACQLHERLENGDAMLAVKRQFTVCEHNIYVVNIHTVYFVYITYRLWLFPRFILYFVLLALNKYTPTQDDPEVRSQVCQIHERLDVMETAMVAFKRQFAAYEYLWTTDIQAMFKEFLK